MRTPTKEVQSTRGEEGKAKEVTPMKIGGREGGLEQHLGPNNGSMQIKGPSFAKENAQIRKETDYTVPDDESITLGGPHMDDDPRVSYR